MPLVHELFEFFVAVIVRLPPDTLKAFGLNVSSSILGLYPPLPPPRRPAIQLLVLSDVPLNSSSKTGVPQPDVPVPLPSPFVQGVGVFPIEHPLVLILPLLDPEGIDEMLGEAALLGGAEEGERLTVPEEGAPAEGDGQGPDGSEIPCCLKSC